MEDYLKAIFTLAQEGRRATTQTLAERLSVAPASVTHMLKRLSEAGLVSYTPYRGVELTDTGRRVAAEIVRHHRLLELYLHQTLGFAWDEVHDEAERLEHFISEELEARIDAALGYPSHDPHGAPIPTLEGHLVDPGGAPLDLQAQGALLEVVQVPDDNPETLRQLADLGVLPGVTLAVLEARRNSVRVDLAGCELRLGKSLARQVLVRPSAKPPTLSADHLQPGQSSRVAEVRARGSRLSRLRELGVEQGQCLRRSATGFHLDARSVDLSREEARSVLVHPLP
jgi:DtxR family Mn-dependent transcriptional regulator